MNPLSTRLTPVLVLVSSSMTAASCAESGFVLTRSERDGSGLGGMGGSIAPTGGGGAAELPESCEPHRSGPDVSTCMSTHFSTQTGATPHVAFSSAGALVVGGAFDSVLPGFEASDTRTGSGPGGLALLPDAGVSKGHHVWLEGPVVALEADPSNARLIVATSEVLSLRDDLQGVHFTHSHSATPLRLDVAPAGEIAVLYDDASISVLSPSGDLTGTFVVQNPATQIAEPLVNDLALSSDGQTVFVVGAHDDPSGGCAGRVPFLRAYDLSGTILAKAYDFDSVDDNCASSIGLRVTRGPEGKIYYAGENQGGNTVHLLDPRDLSSPAPLVSYDPFSQGYGKAIERYGFVARFEPADLAIELGQLILPRDEADEGGEFLIEEVRVGNAGTVAILARATCCSAERDQLQIAGQRVGAYGEAELSLLLLSSDFLRRLTWATPTMTSSAPVSASSLAWRGEVIAVASEWPAGTRAIEHRAHFPESDGAAHLWVLPSP